MSVLVNCRCGWEGSVGAAAAGQPLRCLSCGAPLILPAGATALETTPVDALHPLTPVDRRIAPAADKPHVSVTREYLSLVTAVGQWLWGVIKPAALYVAHAFRFYWKNRGALAAGLRLWFLNRVPLLKNPDDLRREARLPLAEAPRLRNIDEVWQIDLPERCVVCGEETSAPRVQEPRSALDPWGLIVAPLAGLAAGAFLGWWNTSWIWLAIPPAAGIVIGYALRRTEVFVLHLRRCPRHTESTRCPELSVLQRELFLRLGTREVKMDFVRRDHDGPPAGQLFTPPGELFTASESPGPETVPLADSVPHEAAIRPERAEARLSAADERGPDFPA